MFGPACLRYLFCFSFLAISITACTERRAGPTREVQSLEPVSAREVGGPSDTITKEEGVRPDKEEVVEFAPYKLFVKAFNTAGSGVQEIDIRLMRQDKEMGAYHLTQADPLQRSQVADLDGDGKPEVYLFTRAQGSSASSDVKAFYLDFSNTFALMKVLGKLYQRPGYQGHDTVYIKGRQLIRTYPVYKESDPNCCPSGGRATIRYQKVERNNGFVLEEVK